MKTGTKEWISNVFATMGIILIFVGGYYKNLPTTILCLILSIAGAWMIALFYRK